MTTTDKRAPLTKSMTFEECIEMLDRALDASERGDEETSDDLIRQLPLLPVLAKGVFRRYGREYCEEHFNLSAANEEFGEGWMDE